MEGYLDTAIGSLPGHRLSETQVKFYLVSTQYRNGEVGLNRPQCLLSQKEIEKANNSLPYMTILFFCFDSTKKDYLQINQRLTEQQYTFNI